MSRYWDINRPRSYNCLFNFIIGMRNAGKTYTTLRDEILRFISAREKGECAQFLYVRRLSTELEKLTKMRGGRLFQAVAKDPKLKGHKLTAESNILRCDDDIMGYAQPLSTASILKSDAMPDVQEIVFDEFIIDNTGTYHYLKDEVRKFLDLYETVARERNVKVWFLSNAVTVANPYFEEFHLDKPHNGEFQRFGKSRDILVQNVVLPDLQEDKKQSRFGRIIEGMEYGEYAYDNQWLLDNTDFIEKKNQRCEYYLSLRYKDTWLGIWFDPIQWLYYVSLSADLQYPLKYSATLDDHKPNILLMNGATQIPFLRELIDAYKRGAVRYESIKLKAWFRDIMRMTGR